MTQVIFENAGFAEAVKRADRVAPKKGEAYDKAAGLLLEVNAENSSVTLKSTNLDVYYTEIVNHLGISGESAVWRVSSMLFVALVTKLPIGSDKTVKLSSDGGTLHLQSGRFKAKLGLMDPTIYPDWGPFPTDSAAPVSSFGSRIEQVAWATDRGESGAAMTGIRFNGENLAATDRYRLAVVPCEAPHMAGRDLVVPLGVIGPIVKGLGDVSVGLIENFLILMPNPYTQIKCLIYDVQFPPVERVMSRDHEQSIKFDKTGVVEAIGRVITADQKSRMPELRLFIGQGELAMYMEDSSGMDSVGDVVELGSQADHERFEILITPTSLTDALAAAPSERVELHYTVGDRRKILRVSAGSGFESWIVPRAGGGA